MTADVNLEDDSAERECKYVVNIVHSMLDVTISKTKTKTWITKLLLGIACSIYVIITVLVQKISMERMHDM